MTQIQIKGTSQRNDDKDFSNISIIHSLVSSTLTMYRCLFNQQTLVLSMGSMGASASSRHLTVFSQPLAAAQSRGVHRTEFLLSTHRSRSTINTNIKNAKYKIINTHNILNYKTVQSLKQKATGYHNILLLCSFYNVKLTSKKSRQRAKTTGFSINILNNFL